MINRFAPEAIQRSDERRTLSPGAAEKAGVSGDVYVFPWEEIEEQWSEIQAAQSIQESEGE